MSFSNAVKILVKNTVFESFVNNTLTLTLDEQFSNLFSNHVQNSILESLRSVNSKLTLVINIIKQTQTTLAQKELQAHKQYLATIQQEFLDDKIVQKLEQTFNAKVDINSIREITKH